MELQEIKTKQDVFDFVVTHLAQQGGPAKREDGIPAFYSADRTKKCAFGCLIPDERYKVEFESLIETSRLAEALSDNVREACRPDESFICKWGEYDRPDVWLPRMLRLAHDIAENATELRQLLGLIAITHRMWSTKSIKQIVRWEC